VVSPICLTGSSKRITSLEEIVLEYLIFDLDETMYPRRSGLMQAISARISGYMIERMGMDPAVVPDLRRAYWEKYGTTSRGLQLLHGLDVDDYMHYVHDLPLREYVQPDLGLERVLSRLPQEKAIFTNATAAHARAVLETLGVAHHFTRIYDAYFAGNEGKPAIGGYKRLLDVLQARGETCLMVEDSPRNLCPAKALGMVTVLVDPQPGADTDGVDYVIGKVAEIGRVVDAIEDHRVPGSGME
jgi:putative hydrolase of the HAD superfamily